MNGHSFLCSSDNSILCVVDIQPRLLTAMDQDEQSSVISNTSKLLQASRQLYIPSLVSEQYPKGLGHSHSALLEMANESPVIEKTCFSCFGSEEWRNHISQLDRKQLILVGIEAHICVLQTALEAATAGYQVYVVEDAIASRSLNNKKNAILRMQQAGITVTNTESVLFEWLKDAKHPQFKSISKLIS